MKKNLMIAIAVLALSACASEPPKTLDQKLQGATTQERKKEVLRLACLNEAEWPIYHSSAYKNGNTRVKRRLERGYDPEVSDMKALCRKMDALADAGVKKKLPPEVLAGLCAETVADKKHRSRRGGADHAQRIEKICEEMTGKPVNVN